MTYKINDNTFSSKKDVQAKAKEILYDNSINSFLNQEQFEFMVEYFKLFHHEWTYKSGIGIKAIQRIVPRKYKRNRAFQILRKDDSTTDISYYIDRISKPDLKRAFSSALRLIVQPQIIEFKTARFRNKSVSICEVSNQKITFNNCDVDHYSPTFKELVEKFMKEFQIDIKEDMFPKQRDNQTEYELTDEAIKNNFYAFHKKHATLRLTTIQANRRK